jgi:hypothetical protein
MDKEGFQDAIRELAGDGSSVALFSVYATAETRDQHVLMLPLTRFLVGRVRSKLSRDLLNVEVELGSHLDHPNM